MPHEFFPQPGDLYLDTGRLGMDRRTARRAAAEPVLRRAGPRAIAPASSIRRKPSSSWPARRAQPVPAADRAKDDAAGAVDPQRRFAVGSALGRRAAARPWGRNPGLGSRGARRPGQRVLRPDRKPICWSATAPRSIPVRPGSMGRPSRTPGRGGLADGRAACPPAKTGIIAVRRPDPVMFLGYWNNPEATRRSSPAIGA